MKRKFILGIVASGGLAALAFTQISNAASTSAPPSAPAATDEAAPGGPGGPGGKGGPGMGCCHQPGRFHERGPRAFGRDGGRPHHGMWGRELNLTDDQKAKVKEVMEANRPKIEAIRQEEQAKIKAVMDDAQKQIRPILNPAQQQVLDDMTSLRASKEKLRQDMAATKADKKTE